MTGESSGLAEPGVTGGSADADASGLEAADSGAGGLEARDSGVSGSVAGGPAVSGQGASGQGASGQGASGQGASGQGASGQGAADSGAGGLAARNPNAVDSNAVDSDSLSGTGSGDVDSGLADANAIDSGAANSGVAGPGADDLGAAGSGADDGVAVDGAAGSGISVRVVSTDGWAVDGAILTVTDLSGQQVARAVGDADGRLRAFPGSGVPAGVGVPDGADGRGSGGVPAASSVLVDGTYTAIITAVGFGPRARTAMVVGGRADLGEIVLARLAGAALPAAGTWTIDPAHSAVRVSTQHLGLSTVSGRFTSFGGRVSVADPAERSSVAAVIEAGSIDTANAARDEHLRSDDFLAVSRFPSITFNGIGLRANGPDRWVLAGDLTLRDVTKRIELDLTYLGERTDPWGNTRLAVRAVGTLRRGDFSITYNQILAAGIDAVGTKLRVELDIQAVHGDTLPDLST